MDQAAQLQIEDLQKRLEEAEETLRALRNGEVDAIVAAGPEGDRVYTLKGADEPYRAMVQGMAEGACTLAANGLILFSNEQFASILQSPLERVIGARIQDFVAPDDLGLAHRLVAGCGRRRAELRLQSQGGALVTVYLSFEDLIVDGTRCLSAIVTDLTAQKRNEAIVAEGEFARSVLEHAGEAILVVDPDGTIIRGGQAADLLAGVSVLGLRFDEVFEIRVPGGIEYRFRDLAAAANCGEGIRGIEGSALTRTGHTIDVRVRAAKLSLSNGHAGFVFTITDFTELRQAEKALRRSEERRKIAEAVQTERQRLNEVLENLPVMVSLLTPDYQVRFANSRFREFFGESNGRRCYEYIAGLSEPCPQCQTFLPLKTQSPNQWEYRGSDGACLAVYNLPFKDADGSPLIVEVDVDITERKRAEAALRESEERFRNLADTAPVMIWVSGTDKACTFFNKAWLNFTGKTMPEESRGGWADGIHPEDLERSRATYCKAFEARSPYRMEYRRRSADGSYRWVRSDGVPRFGPDGLFAGYIGSCIDVTDTKRTHEELLARQKLETVGVLAGGVAHDFNNLLGSILANLELASAELPDDSPLRLVSTPRSLHPGLTDPYYRVAAPRCCILIAFRGRPDQFMRLKHACFVSYRHGQYDLMKEFTSDFCSALCGELEPLLGTAGVFLDQQRLEGGSFYNEALARDLFDSATMAMVYTPTYFDSDHTFCTREFRAMEALERRRLGTLGLPVASTNGLIIPVVLRGARYLPTEIRNLRQYYNFESFLLGGRRLSRHPKFAPAIREMAGYICARYHELSRLPDEEFQSMEEFRLPDDDNVKPLLSMTGGFQLPFPRGASLCTSAAP